LTLYTVILHLLVKLVNYFVFLYHHCWSDEKVVENITVPTSPTVAALPW